MLTLEDIFEMKHIVMTRFSLFHGAKWPAHSPMWSAMGLTDADMADENKKNDAYLRYLYGDERLAYKWKSLTHLTIPWTLKAMDKVEDAEWWFFVSPPSVMPSHILEKLKAITGHDTRIHIKELDVVNQNFGKSVSRMVDDATQGARFCTLRLDDDDAFHESLMSDIDTLALSKPEPFVYCSTWGAKCKLENDGTLVTGDLWEHWSQHAIGLAGVDVNVFALGNHGNIATNHPGLEIVHDREKKLGFLLNCEPKFTASRRVF